MCLNKTRFYHAHIYYNRNIYYKFWLTPHLFQVLQRCYPLFLFWQKEAQGDDSLLSHLSILPLSIIEIKLCILFVLLCCCAHLSIFNYLLESLDAILGICILFVLLCCCAHLSIFNNLLESLDAILGIYMDWSLLWT